VLILTLWINLGRFAGYFITVLQKKILFKTLAEKSYSLTQLLGSFWHGLSLNSSWTHAEYPPAATLPQGWVWIVISSLVVALVSWPAWVPSFLGTSGSGCFFLLTALKKTQRPS
jgi:hypothetical protein